MLQPQAKLWLAIPSDMERAISHREFYWAPRFYPELAGTWNIDYPFPKTYSLHFRLLIYYITVGSYHHCFIGTNVEMLFYPLPAPPPHCKVQHVACWAAAPPINRHKETEGDLTKEWVQRCIISNFWNVCEIMPDWLLNEIQKLPLVQDCSHYSASLATSHS